jgi:cell division protein FtsB
VNLGEVVSEAKGRDEQLKSFLRKPRRKRQFGRLVIVLILLLFCYFFLAGDYGLIKIWAQRRQIEKLEQETHRLRAEQFDLKQQCLKLQSDSAYIEKKVREELGMIRPGERVYQFVAPPDTTEDDI